MIRRLSDEKDNARDEAILGLAQRHDERALGPALVELERNFARDEIAPLAIEAAQVLRDPVFLPLLLRLRDAWADDSYYVHLLSQPVVACGGIDE